jgi:DNA-binding MarR family transcriptional regulator
MPIHHCPCFNLGLAHRRVARAFEEALAPLNLTIAQVHFLSCLYEQDARLSKDLARELAVDAGTLTPMVDRLERMGLIRRCPHPEDRRASRICLEPAGRRLEAEIAVCCRTATERLMTKFSDEDYTQFMRLIRLLTEDAGEKEMRDASPAEQVAGQA